MRIPSILLGGEYVCTTVDSRIPAQVLIMGTSKEKIWHIFDEWADLTVPLNENPVFSSSSNDKSRLRYHEFTEKTSFLNCFYSSFFQPGVKLLVILS